MKLRNTIKGLIIVLGIILVLSSVLLTFLFTPVVSNVIEKGLPNIIGGNVDIKIADCSFWTGNMLFQNIKIKNPGADYKDGFDVLDMGKSSSNGYFLQLPQIRVTFEPLSLFTKTIVIKEIIINSGELQYKKNGDSDTLDRIITHINHYFEYDSLAKVNINKVLEEDYDSYYNVRIDKIKFIDCKVIGESDKIEDKLFEIELDTTPILNPTKNEDLPFKKIVYGAISVMSKYIKDDIASRANKVNVKKKTRKSLLGGSLKRSNLKDNSNSSGIDTKSLKQKSTKGSLF